MSRLILERSFQAHNYCGMLSSWGLWYNIPKSIFSKMSNATTSEKPKPKRKKRTKQSVQSKEEEPTANASLEQFSIFEGIKCAPIALMNGRLPQKSWTKAESQWWFFFIKRACNERDVRERLTLLAWYHPQLLSYAKGNLDDTKEWWADCYTAWEFTGGAQYSSVAEQWFSSITSVLGKEQTPLVDLVNLMRKGGYQTCQGNIRSPRISIECEDDTRVD